MSLVEVLIATSIIAVAVYGMIAALGAQQMSEVRLRDRKVLTQLHYQLVREVLKNQRNGITVDGTYRLGLDTGGVTKILQSTALGSGAVAYFAGNVSGSGASRQITTQMWLKRDNNGTVATLGTNTLIFSYPYTGNSGRWDQVRP